MSGTMNDESTGTIQRLEHELSELKRSNERLTRRLRQLRGGAIAIGVCLVVLGVGASGWFGSIRAQVPAPPGGFQLSAPAPVAVAPVPPLGLGVPLIEVGRYYLSPYNITHSYVSNGRRLLFFGAAQPIVLDDRESELIRRYVSLVAAPMAPGEPGAAPPAVDPDGRVFPSPAVPRAPGVAPSPPVPTAPG